MISRACPVCGTPGIHGRSLTCSPCWAKVPRALKWDIIAAYRERATAPALYYAIRATTIASLRDLQEVTAGSTPE